jgi:hypothetical protein
MLMPGSLLDGCTNFVDNKLKNAGAHPFDAKGDATVTALPEQMMKGRIDGGMAGLMKNRDWAQACPGRQEARRISFC